MFRKSFLTKAFFIIFLFLSGSLFFITSHLNAQVNTVTGGFNCYVSSFSVEIFEENIHCSPGYSIDTTICSYEHLINDNNILAYYDQFLETGGAIGCGDVTTPALCTFNCVQEGSRPTANWGEPCDGNTLCSSSPAGLTCRSTSTSRRLCLKNQGSVPLGGQCNDVSECAGVGIAPRQCGTIASGNTKVCYNPENPTDVTPEDSGLYGDTQCRIQQWECPAGETNLYNAISSGSISVTGNNISTARMLSLLALAFPFQSEFSYNNICISNNVSAITTIFNREQVEEEDLPTVGSGGIDVPRACADGSIPSTNNYTRPGVTNPAYGCCPAGYRFVTIDLRDIAADPGNLQQKGNNACCYVGNNEYDPQFWDSTAQKCMFGKPEDGVFTPQDRARFHINNYPSGNSPAGFPYIITQHEGPYYYANHGAPPPFGVPIGRGAIGQNINLGQEPENRYTCAHNTDGCAVIRNNINPNEAQGPNTITSDITNLNSKLAIGNIITDSQFFDRQEGASYQCQSCLAFNEVIGFREGESKVLLCRNGNIYSTDMVNGNVNDTLACLRSEGGESGSNYETCKSCRESGGVWTGLGCVDTSATGIITWIIRIAFGVMGGVALIQFIIAGIYYQTGQEEKVREARKNIMATLTGLAVLTFSILILRIIGVNILDILPTGLV